MQVIIWLVPKLRGGSVVERSAPKIYKPKNDKIIIEDGRLHALFWFLRAPFIIIIIKH